MTDESERQLGCGLESLAPLLKWPGGKRVLLPALRAHLPDSYNRYYEPFLGGAALFLSLRPASASLSDTNSDLINCYRCVRDCPSRVIRSLQGLPNNEDAYLLVRTWRPRKRAERAARIIYLASLSFNGIYRVNRKGEFNVPYGHKSSVDVVQAERIMSMSRALEGASLSCSDFEEAVSAAVPGDLVYMDPPYTVTHGRNGFLKYNSRIFSWGDQERLARVARDLAGRGCHVLVTNACHPSIRELYTGMTLITVTRHSRMAASPKHRGRVSELIISNLA